MGFIKRVLRKTELSVDDLFFCLLVVMAELALFFPICKLNQVASLFFAGIIFLTYIWFLFKIVLLFKNRRKQNKSKSNARIFLIAILFIAFCFISIIVNAFYIKNIDFISVSSCKKAVMCISAVLFLCCLNTARINKSLVFVLCSLSIFFTLLIVLLFAIGYSRTWYGHSSWHNLTLNYSNPNLAALILFYQILVLILGFHYFRSKIIKIIVIVCLCANFFLLFLTSSRTVFIAIGFAIFILFISRFIKDKRATSLFACLIPLIFAFVYITISYLRQTQMTENLMVASYVSANGKSLGTRISIWIIAFKNILGHPIFGQYFSFNESHFHNSYLDMWTTFGLIPLILFIILVFISVLKLLKKQKYVLDKIILFCCLSSLFTMIGETTITQATLGSYVLSLCFFGFLNTDLGSVFEKYKEESNCKNCNLLILTNVYSAGSIGKQCRIIKDGLEQLRFSTAVLYGRNTINKNSLVYKCCSEIESLVSKFLCKIFRKQYSFNLKSTLEVVDFIKKSHVQVINLHAINDNYINYKILLSFCKKHNLKVVFTAHSGNLIFGGCGGNNFDCLEWKEPSGCLNCKRANSRKYRKNWAFNAKLFSNFKNFSIVCVSKYLEYEFKKCSYFKDKSVVTIMDCVGEEFKPTYDFENKELFNLQNFQNKVLFVTPSLSNPNKGFNFLLEIAKRMPDYNFVCVSYENKPSLSVNNISFIGPVYSDLIMAKIYSFCDVTLVLSKSETFCLPVAESLSCGTPVVGFKCGGAENIALPNYSQFFNYGEIDEIINCIRIIKNLKKDSISISSESSKVYSKENLILQYTKLFDSMIIGKNYFEVEI